MVLLMSTVLNQNVNIVLFHCNCSFILLVPQNSNLGGEILWTNQNPKNSFPAQTINVDTSSYSTIIIEFRYSIAQDYIGTRVLATPSDTFVRFGAGCVSSGPAYGRVFHIITNGIEFKDAMSGTAVQNTILIPYRIFGYKLNIL